MRNGIRHYIVITQSLTNVRIEPYGCTEGRSSMCKHVTMCRLQIVEVFGYMGGYLGMWLGFSLFSILSGLEDKFERFLIRRAHALKKTPA